MSSLLHAIEVLLVDDDPADVELTREALKASNTQLVIQDVSNGVEAMKYLRKEASYEKVQRPDLILLDLNMPKKDGREVLADIRADESLRMIPVVILTTSDAEIDICKSYQLGTNCYVTKPAGLAQLMQVVKTIEHFWFTIVKLPQEK